MHETLSSHGGETTGNDFRLGNLRIDPVAGLIEGPEGTEQVDPKVMAVLVALAVHAGELVTRQDLLDAVWPERIVTDDVLSRCIYQLRRHLVAATGKQARRDLVETLPRRGYRLNAEVLPDTHDRKTGPRRWRLTAFVSVLALVLAWWAWQRQDNEATPLARSTAPPVVAVLPFVDLSAESDQEYFADGISEELINLLARIPSLKVIARSSAFQFKGKNPGIATVADQLNATHVLEGAVRSMGNRVRISAQLVSADDGHPLWSDTFEREVGDIFAIQDEVAQAVARALELNLAPQDLEEEAPTSGAAYVHFMQAQRLFNRRRPGDLKRAAIQYRRALDITPGFARAWAGLAGVYMVQTFNQDLSEAEGFTLIRKAATRALELDPAQPEGNFRMARLLDMQGDPESAAPYWEAARRHGKSNPVILGVLAGKAWQDGELDKAIDLYRQAIALDPLSTVSRGNLAHILLLAGRLAESREAALATLALRPENEYEGRWMTGGVLVATALLENRAEEALSLLEGWPEEDHERSMYTAMAYDSLGRISESDAIIERMQDADDFLGAIHLAQVFSHRGDLDAAFAWLDTALGRLDPGSSNVQRAALFSRFHSSPFLKPLHDDPRWHQWLDRSRSRPQ